MKKVALTLFIMLSVSMLAQNNTCSETNYYDLNKISKCVHFVKNGSDMNSKTIAVRVSSKRTRFLKNRTNSKASFESSSLLAEKISLAKKITPKKASTSINNITSSGIENTKVDNSIVKEEIASVEVSKNKVVKVAKGRIIKFSETTTIPLFSNCKEKNKEKNSACFNKNMAKHINKNFDYPKNAIVNNIQGDVWVRFIIDENGNVTNITTKASKNKEILEKEAYRVISKLPKFKAGKVNDQNVKTSYALPISFSLD